MSLRLRELGVAEYAEHVLPLTAPLWAGDRSLELYREHTRKLAQTAYGRASYRTMALVERDEILASFKRYEREAHLGNERLRAMGIGAVFTPPDKRRAGFASAMLAMALDDARSRGTDFALLFSDIHPQFYKEIGFRELPSRSISFRADGLPAQRIDARPIEGRDWSAVRACFDSMQDPRGFGLVRTVADWTWMRERIAQSSANPRAQSVHLAVRAGRRIVAYVLGRREPRHDAYVLDEFGFADDAAAALVPPLLRCAAGDLRRITGWLPPEPARSVLPRGSVRKRSDAILMIAPLSDAGTRFLERAARASSADAVWSLDHV